MNVTASPLYLAYLTIVLELPYNSATERGSSSVVERQLPKLDVASSNLVSRFGSFLRKHRSRTQVAKGAVCKTAITSSILVGSSPIADLKWFVCLKVRLVLR